MKHSKIDIEYEDGGDAFTRTRCKVTVQVVASKRLIERAMERAGGREGLEEKLEKAVIGALEK